KTSSRHVDPAGRPYTYNPAVLDELAAWWATTPLTDRPALDLQTAPGLTPDTGDSLPAPALRRPVPVGAHA
ncbi:MAG: hypothetical protein ACRCYU_11285, partial [Nocardioides sp.]